ncbi:MAG: HlyD family secretion protein [Alphaproteobacteria bacterium]|nr:HlyD family secretion protein [Alphaproteobacteria bacterium]
MTSSAEDGAALARNPAQRRFGRAIAGFRPLAGSRARRSWRQRVRLPLMLGGPLLVLLVAMWWYLTGGRYVSTDDAYVQAARTSISADISGRVVAVEVRDNQPVAAGQVLFRIDDRPFRIAIEEATAQLAMARLQIEALKATYRQKVADEAAAENTLSYQQREFDRQRRLLASGFSPQAQYDQTANALEIARQKVASAQHDMANVLAQLGGNADIAIEQHPAVQRAAAALDRARLDLSYTVVRAPEAGVVTKVEQLQPGDYVSASTPVFSMMSDRVWVEANFKETELTHMRQGQRATVEIDTYPDAVFRATVISLSPGTGLTFSLLPAENATGNWVKVVQRLPVRLELDGVGPDMPSLHAGLSATVEVDTHYRRPLLARLARLFGQAEAAGPSR